MSVKKTKAALAAISHACEAKVIYSTKTAKADRKKVISSQQSVDILRPFYSEIIEQREMFSVLLLNRANEVVTWAKICEGTAFSCIVDIQYIMRLAILSNAQCIILCHNHPSGNLQLSQADENITKKIKEATKLFDITLLDHVVLTLESYYSFADNGNL